MRLYRRTWRVRVGALDEAADQRLLDVSELDVDFRIEKTLQPEPNKCSLTIYNLSSAHRRAIEALNLYDPKKAAGQKSTGSSKSKARAPKVGRIRVEIEAGYEQTGMALLFRGDLRRAVSVLEDDGTYKTEIEGEDGGRSVLSSRIRETFPPGTSLLIVVQALASAVGLGVGNILEVQDELARRAFTHGTTCYGAAADELKGVLRGAGLAYSIQNGVLSFRRANPLRAQAVILNQDSGLVGAPERDSSGMVSAVSLLNPRVSVGGFVQLESQAYPGVYQVVRIEHVGETAGDSWYHQMELRPA